MNSSKIKSTLMALSASLITTASISPAEAGLDQFNQLGNANWRSTGSEIHADQGNGFLVSKDSYGDFHLKVQFRAETGTNSGIFIRCSDPKKIDDKTCYEANIFDTRPDQTYRTGAITGLAAPKTIVTTEDGSWHTYEIYAVGDKIRTLVDGKETVYVRNQNLSSGPVALQLAQGEIRFRGLEITRLASDALKPARSALDGVWELESMDVVDRAGNSRPWCAGSFGVIIYTRNYMSTAVNCTSDPGKSVLYSGPFEIQDRTVFHHAQNFSDASLNKVFSRGFQLKDGNHLELTGALGESTVVVRWARR